MLGKIESFEMYENKLVFNFFFKKHSYFLATHIIGDLPVYCSVSPERRRYLICLSGDTHSCNGALTTTTDD